MNFQQGAFGPPAELTTLVRFWTIMEQLHYPTAAQMKKDLQTELGHQREQQARTAAMQTALTGSMGGGGAEQAEVGISAGGVPDGM